MNKNTFVQETKDLYSTPVNIFSMDGIKKLDKEALLERIEQVDNQSALVKWRLYWELSQRFSEKGKNGFEGYINTMRDKYNIDDSFQNISRMVLAGKFAEKHNITDLNKVGIGKTVFYELSRTLNAGFADNLYHDIKRKNISYNDVLAMIDKLRVVHIEGYNKQRSQTVLDNIDKVPLAERGRYVVPVVNNVAMSKPVPAQVDVFSDIEQLDKAFTEPITTTEASVWQPALVNTPERRSEVNLTRAELINLLAMQDMSSYDDEQIVAELLIICESYKRSWQRLIIAGQLLVKVMSNNRYQKVV